MNSPRLRTPSEDSMCTGLRLPGSGHGWRNTTTARRLRCPLGTAEPREGRGPPREVPDQIRSWTPNGAAVSGAVIAIILGAPILERPSIGVREAVAVDREPREVAVMAGAIVGARVGPHRWPWQIVNDLWFAELGRRLANNDGRYEDLRDAYAVEEGLP